MATATKNFGTVKLTSSYTAYQNATGDKWTSTANTVNSATFDASFANMGIVAGSTVNSVVISWGTTTNPLHGSATRTLTYNGTEHTSVNSGVSVNGAGSFQFTFKSGKSSTTYPTKPASSGTTAERKNSSIWEINNVTVTISYTLPYTKCSPPTSVSTPTNVLPSTNYTLSWSGAAAGTNNAITGYQLYRASTENSTYVALGTKIADTDGAGSATVTSHATNGSSYYYKVVTIGTQSGYNSEQSSAAATMKSYVTAVVVPTAVSVSATNVIPNTNVTLSWSGAKVGTNNAITGYEVYRSNTSNGTYTKLGSKINTSSTSGSITVTAHSTPNSTYYYKVKTIGTIAGFDASNPSTVYATLSSQVSACSAPASFSSTPSLYESTLTVSWSGQAAGTNNPITSYNIEYQVSNDGITWGTATATTSTTASKEINTSAIAAGAYLRFKVKSIGTISGYDSGWSTYSSSYRKNRTPITPTITYPVNGSTTYNTTPYVKVVVAAEPDGQTQTLQYKIGTGAYVAATAVPAGGGTFIFQTSALTAGSRTITVRVVDATGGISSEESRTITVNTTPFTDSTLTTSTPIKAIHLNEIRARATNMLTYFGLPAATWTDTITAGITPVKAIHITELQNSLKSCATAAETSRTFTTVRKNTRMAKAHIEQLRIATTQL